MSSIIVYMRMEVIQMNDYNVIKGRDGIIIREMLDSDNKVLNYEVAYIDMLKYHENTFGAITHTSTSTTRSCKTFNKLEDALKFYASKSVLNVPIGKR